jgi:hypothetical protein
MGRWSSQGRRSSRVIAAALAVVACSGSTEPVVPADLRLEAVTSTSLTGPVGYLVTPVPVVRVTTLDGTPVSGVTVEFRVSAGGSIKNRAAKTDRDGLASVGSWQLGTVATSQPLTVRIPNGPSLEFTAVAAPGPVTHLISISGNLQSIAVGERLAQPLRVRVTDAYNNDIPNVPVIFTVLADPSSPTEVTSDNVATATLSDLIVSNSAPGHYQIRASAGSATTVFTVTVCRTSCRNEELLFLNGFTQIRANVAGETISVTESGAWWAQAAWSSTGRVAFVNIENFDLADLYIANVDGSNAKKIGRLQHPSWSPDGSSLVVTTESCNANCDIMLLRLAGDSAVPTMTFAKVGESPAWSPDGKKIAFISFDPTQLQTRLETMNVDGSDRHVVAEGAAEGTRPSWSPDGQRIAYSRCHTRCDIYVAAVHEPLNLLLVQGGVDPAWSPDGTWIAFTSLGTIDGTYISYVAADGRTPPLRLSQAGYWPVWKTVLSLNR